MSSVSGIGSEAGLHYDGFYLGAGNYPVSVIRYVLFCRIALALRRYKKRGCVIMAHLGRRPRASGSVIDLSQLPSPSPSGSYHLNHSDSTLSIRMQKRRWSNFDTAPLFFSAFRQMAGGSQSEVFNHASAVGCTLMKRRPSLPVENTTTPSTRA